MLGYIGHLNDFQTWIDSIYEDRQKNFIVYVMSYQGRKKQLKRLRKKRH